MSEPPLAVPLGPRLRPDAGRVITRLFVPGEELPESVSRGRSVIDRILALEDDDVAASMAELTTRFAGRHRDLGSVLREHSTSPRTGERTSPGSRRTADC
jgi:hypothetical protein